MTLLNIFESYGIKLKINGEFRHPVDILEDIYLKLSIEEFRSLIEKISDIESKEGFIFDLARGRPYQ